MTVKPKIILDDEDDAVIVRGGITVKFNAKGGVEVYGSAPVTLHPAANDSEKAAAKAEPEIGETMPDGTIFAGVSPDTGRNMFVTPRDAPGTLKWKAAMKYAADLDAHGHKDWKLPTEGELDVLYQNRHKGALKGTFDESSGGWYWSSTEYTNSGAWRQRFSDGNRSVNVFKYLTLLVRCVRR